MALKFENLQDKLDNYAGRSNIHAEEVLQLMLTLCDDIRWETGTPVAACKIGNGDYFLAWMISLSKTLQQLYQVNAEKISELRRAGDTEASLAKLRQITEVCEEAAEELSKSKLQRETLEMKKQQLQKTRMELENQKMLCQGLTQEIEMLRMELQKLDCLNVQKLENERDSIKNKYQQSKSFVEALLKETAELEKNFKQDATVLEKARNEKQQMEEKLCRVKNERLALQQSTRDLGMRLQEQEQFSDSLRQQKTALEQQIDRQQEDNRKFRDNELNAAQGELHSARAEYEGLTAEWDKANKECADLQKQVQDVNIQNAAIRAGIEAVQTELDKLLAARAQLEEQKGKLDMARQEHMESIQKMKEKAIGLQLEADNLKSSNEAYRTNILENAQAEYEQLQGEKDGLLQKKEQLDIQSVRIQAQIQDITEQMNRIQTEIGILQVKKEKADKEAEGLGEKKKALDEQISKVSQYCRNTQQSIQQLEQQLREMNAEKIEETLSRKKQTLEEACERCKSQQEQQAGLDEAIREKQRQISVADAELSELKKTEEQLQKELKSLDNLLHPLGEASYREQVKKLKTRLEILQGVKEKLERDSERLCRNGAFSLEDGLKTDLDMTKVILDTLQKSIIDYSEQWQQSL